MCSTWPTRRSALNPPHRGARTNARTMLGLNIIIIICTSTRARSLVRDDFAHLLAADAEGASAEGRCVFRWHYLRAPEIEGV